SDGRRRAEQYRGNAQDPASAAEIEHAAVREDESIEQPESGAGRAVFGGAECGFRIDAKHDRVIGEKVAPARGDQQPPQPPGREAVAPAEPPVDVWKVARRRSHVLAECGPELLAQAIRGPRTLDDADQGSVGALLDRLARAAHQPGCHRVALAGRT